ILGTESMSMRLRSGFFRAKRSYSAFLSRLVCGGQCSSVCWESNFLTHGWRSVPVVVQKQLLWSGVAFELESKHFYGFAFKVLYSRPDSDKGCRLWSVSWNRFLQVDEYISLSRICDRG